MSGLRASSSGPTGPSDGSSYWREGECVSLLSVRHGGRAAPGWHLSAACGLGDVDTAMVHRHNGMSPHADDCPAWFTGNPRLDGQPDVCTCGAAGSPPPEALRQPVDTYTPGLWVTLSEDEKYAEYIRVRTLL